MKERENIYEFVELMKKYDEIAKEVSVKLAHLPAYYLFHNLAHTKDVDNSADKIALVEGVNPWDRRLWLIKTAAQLHDIGFLYSEKGGKEHEKIGAEFAETFLLSKGYNLGDISLVSGMIRATKFPQSPKNLLEKILCDADLDNFGRDDFFERGELLRKELEGCGIKKPDKEWYEGVLKLLESHEYFTEAARLLRDHKKAQNIEKLKGILSRQKKDNPERIGINS